MRDQSSLFGLNCFVLSASGVKQTKLDKFDTHERNELHSSIGTASTMGALRHRWYPQLLLSQGSPTRNLKQNRLYFVMPLGILLV